MSADSKSWMSYVVDLAAAAPPSGMRVGAVLVSKGGQLVCCAFEGEEPGKSWRYALQRKMQEGGATTAHSIYLTINTLSTDRSFDLAGLQRETGSENTYVGLPDPTLTSYRDDDPVTTGDNVFRLPDDLQREILDQNLRIYEESEQRIQCNPHYSTHRIGESVFSSLTSHGFTIPRREVNANRKVSALASLIREKHRVGHEEALRVVQASLAEAFDVKYGSYEDAYDARSAYPNWINDFASVYDSISSKPLRSHNILNVGVGAGSEAAALFSDCHEITFVDIAERGLKRVAERYPSAKTLIASADDLSEIPDDSYDLHVSLRTYNSSFFDTSAAASEAHRVLHTGGLIIVSVANGFLHTERDRAVVPGLILPGTDFVDLYRGMDTARMLRDQLRRAGFKNIQMVPTTTEILLSGVAA